MATELDQTYCGWPHQELLGQEDSQDAAIAQMLDQGSISFGRFTVESLAWEKRSVFTHNRCQEELEKLKAPGLVAQKKAYFEAYYKRIHTLKALQANEQTELVVDYRGDDSSSCKNGELEDESVENGTLRNGSTNVTAGCLEGHAAEAAIGVECSGALCCRHSDSKSVVTWHDFSTGTITDAANPMHTHQNDDMLREPADSSTTASFKEIDTDKNSVDSLHCGHLDPETSISYDDFCRADVEDAELKKNCSTDLQMGHISEESTVLDSPRRTEEIELLKSLCSDDDEWNVKEALDAECSIDSKTRAEHNGADSPVPKSVSELLLVNNHVTGEPMVLLNKQKGHSLTPRIKEAVSSIRFRKTKKMECRTKPEATKASQQPKYLLHKTAVLEEKKASASNAPSRRLPSKNNSSSDISYRPQKVHSSLLETVIVVKEGNSTNLRGTKYNSLPKKNNSVSVSSDRPFKGSSSNVTISHPLSFATQKQSSTPCGIREIGSRNSSLKSLNGSIYATKQLPMQNASVKRHAAGRVKTAVLEKKSHHGEIPKTASVLSSHTATSRARDGLLQRPEARSINLPAVSKYSLASRTGCGLKGERPKEAKNNARPRLYEGTSKVAASPVARTNKTNLREAKNNARPRLYEGTSKVAASPVARTNKTNLREQVSTQTHSLLLRGKQSGQEVKPWR